MHEYSIVRALLDRVEAEARRRQATAVRRVEVRIGDLAGVEPDLLAAAYEAYRAGTVCEGAPLAIERAPARWACTRCHTPVPSGGFLACASCGGPPRLESGDEIMLERIEMEVA